MHTIGTHHHFATRKRVFAQAVDNNPMDKRGSVGIGFGMLKSASRDPLLESVVKQLLRVQWISGYRFVEGEGYLLEWLPEGSQRMMLLQIAVKKNAVFLKGLGGLDSVDRETARAIGDFWNACMRQLALEGKTDSQEALVRIIESWQPRGNP